MGRDGTVRIIDFVISFKMFKTLRISLLRPKHKFRGKIKIVASFSTSSITEYVDIYSYYNVKVNLSARFKQRIGEK